MPIPHRANRDLIRAINRSTVLNTVKNHGPVSRTSIARRTGLSAATITTISAQLIQDGLVFEKETGDSSGGRRPILLALNPRGGFVIGLKLADDHITGAITDLDATTLANRTALLDGRSLEDALDALTAMVLALLEAAKIRRDQLLGVGLGLAGIVDHHQGVLRYSTFFGWRDIPLAARLEARLNTRVYIDNDVNTLTITEQWFGRGKGYNHFLVVTIGRGVGLGIVLNGQVYQGQAGGAGEFGHTVIDPDGPLCDCGKRGCLEAYASDPVLLARAGEAIQRGELPEDAYSHSGLLQAGREGNPAALEIYRRAGQVLGMGIANLVNILTPQLIIISGEGVRAGELLFAPLREALQTHVMPGLAGNTRLQVDAWDDDAWARGAAGLVLRQLFESPIHHEEPVRA